MKKTKILLSTIAVSLLVAACESTPQRVNQTAYNLTSNQESLIGTSSTNASDFSVKAAPSSAPKDNVDIPKSPPSNLEKPSPTIPQKKKRVVSYTDTPVITDESAIVPGMIEVVYKNSSNIKIDKSSEKVSILSNNKTDSGLVASVLQKFGVKSAEDIVPKGMSESEMMKEHRIASSKLDGELPYRTSIHTYHFAKDADVKKISKALAQLPFVSSAHPVLELNTSASFTHLGRVNQSSSGTNPGTGHFNETESNWWWFNAQKIFQGWDVYGDTPKTTIAVIDTGFDMTANAKDKPNYQQAFSVTGCGGNINNCNVNFGSNAVQETQSPANQVTFSHGTYVATIAASPLNNGEGLSGIAPGAKIIPIKAERTYTMDGTLEKAAFDRAAVQKSINEAANYSNVDAINLSISADNVCPSVYVSHSLRAETEYATSVKDKVVVWAAGNKRRNIDGCSYDIAPPSYVDYSGGSIIVGGSTKDSVHSRVKGWDDSSSQGSNYNTSNHNGKVVHMTAAGNNLHRTPYYDPSDGTSGYLGASYNLRGTSMAAPMVAAAAGMMRRISSSNGGSLTAAKTKNLLINSSDYMRYTPGHSSGDETRFTGEDLENQVDANMVGMRTLNLFSALTLAKYSHKYQAITRMTNVDDQIYASINWDWPNQQYTVEHYGQNSFFGINGLSSGDLFTFYNYNSVQGGKAYGYQVYKNSELSAERYEGVSGVAGSDNNGSFATGFYDGWATAY
jgi:hypothetical protein